MSYLTCSREVLDFWQGLSLTGPLPTPVRRMFSVLQRMFRGVEEAIVGSILSCRAVTIIVLCFFLIFCMASFGDCTVPHHHETTIITGDNLNIRVEKVGSAFYRSEESDILYPFAHRSFRFDPRFKFHLGRGLDSKDNAFFFLYYKHSLKSQARNAREPHSRSRLFI